MAEVEKFKKMKEELNALGENPMVYILDFIKKLVIILNYFFNKINSKK